MRAWQRARSYNSGTCLAVPAAKAQTGSAAVVIAIDHDNSLNFGPPDHPDGICSGSYGYRYGNSLTFGPPAIQTGSAVVAIYVYIYIYTHRHIYVYTYTHLYVCMYIYICVCERERERAWQRTRGYSSGTCLACLQPKLLQSHVYLMSAAIHACSQGGAWICSYGYSYGRGYGYG